MSEPRVRNRYEMRVVLLGLVTFVGVLGVAARLAFLTVMARESLKERGELQHQHTLKLDARRGTILDRHGRELATSVEVESVYAVPKAFEAELANVAARSLASCLGEGADRVASRLGGGKSFAWLKRKATPAQVACVRSLGLEGVGFLPESRRFYPKRNLASQVIGYVGIDNEGMSGVEYALESEVRGMPGRRIIWTDARKRRAASRVEVRPEPGRSAYLTLDENLQYMAEVELTRAIEESQSKSGIAILMRPATGEILAMAAYPTFNPNRYGDFPESHWRNRAVTDVYEPGSTFKIVAAAAALEEGVTSEEERIDCGTGSIQVGEQVIRDHRVFDVLTFREVIENSSNVGMIRIGQRLGKERLARYVRAFGFGKESGVELPAESRGILRPEDRWGPVTLASISFGQEIGVTPLQMVTAANAIATSGYLMRPQLVLGFGSPTGGIDRAVRPEPVGRVVSEQTARRIQALLEGVVARGTGRRAGIPGYRVAGKTGTAQKAVPGGYSKTDYIASFVGYAPAERPAVTALVILDSPAGDHSGSRAAAVFSRIVGRALDYLAVPPDAEPPLTIAKVWPQSRPILESREAELGGDGERREGGDRGVSTKSASHFSENDPPGLEALDQDTDTDPRVPSVIGLPARDAVARFVRNGLVPEIVGTGWVVEQHPDAGSGAELGARSRLVLAPTPPRQADEAWDAGSDHPAPVPMPVPRLAPSAGPRVVAAGFDSSSRATHRRARPRSN